MSYDGSSARIGQGWITALDFNWQGQGTGSISSDGDVVIGGVTWNKFNSTNDQSAMAYSASGLVIQPKSTSDYNTTRTMPGLWTSLVTLIPGLELSYGIRAWTYWSADNCAANYDSSTMAIATNGTTLGFVFQRGYTLSGAGTTEHYIVSGANPAGFSDSAVALGDSNRVLAIEVPHLGYTNYKCYRGAWSSGWPAFSSLVPMSATFATRVGGFTTATAGVTVAAGRAGSGTSLSVTLARLRIDYFPR